MEIMFPLKGKDTNFALSKQPPLTTPYLQNARPYDVLGERARGGPRPPVRKRYSQQICGAALRIDALLSVTVNSG